MEKIARENLRSILRERGRRIASATFVKKDGTDRKILFRLGVKKHLRGGTNNVERDDRSYMTVYDMKHGGYRTINLRTVKTLSMDGKQYEVV